MAISDAQIGSNVTVMREDLSQKEVALRMKEKGWRWSQATVWSIEKGERPLRLAEANDLAMVLKCSVFDLLLDDGVAPLRQARGDVLAARDQLNAAVFNFSEVQINLFMLADRLDPPGGVDREGTEDLLRLNPIEIIKDFYIRDRADSFARVLAEALEDGITPPTTDESRISYQAYLDQAKHFERIYHETYASTLDTFGLDLPDFLDVKKTEPETDG